MKDVTTTSFGLVIAYLLPGLAAIATCSSWSHAIKLLFQNVAAADTNFGSIFYLVLISILSGVQINVFRWVIFERILARENCLSSADFAKLAERGKLAGFSAAIDENFRYHQCYGAFSVVLPFTFVAFMQRTNLYIDCGFFFYFLIFLAIEVPTVFAALEALRRYRERLNAIFK